jgi:hypothetical protein
MRPPAAVAFKVGLRGVASQPTSRTKSPDRMPANSRKGFARRRLHRPMKCSYTTGSAARNRGTEMLITSLVCTDKSAIVARRSCGATGAESGHSITSTGGSMNFWSMPRRVGHLPDSVSPVELVMKPRIGVVVAAPPFGRAWACGSDRTGSCPTTHRAADH